MAKQKYVLLGPEVGAAGEQVMKELATYEGDAIKLDGEFVLVRDNQAQEWTVAIIRLAQGQSIKRKE